VFLFIALSEDGIECASGILMLTPNWILHWHEYQCAANCWPCNAMINGADYDAQVLLRSGPTDSVTLQAVMMILGSSFNPKCW